ncbi:PREDICTED: uncharacterized protein LOC104810888 isoform X2 [Tarenaya hassleriana]|nr:PREDICTED: uncharacterized protein LOC104810888 isoform X2 [Tarenaya hassleriana]
MGDDHVDKSLVPESGSGFSDTFDGSPESMDKDIGGNNDESASERDGKKLRKSSVEEAWEEHGCVLWDLAASRTHAELMVENLILEVLYANLMVSKSTRVTEICLGIIGNLACHEAPLRRIESTDGLVNAIVGQLFLDDTQCLSEVCRILTSGLYGAQCTFWAESLQSEDILQRLLWITENTLNTQLIEKSVGLLLAILEGQPSVQHLLIPPLMNLGLANLLINLFSFEMDKMTERIPERYPVLDIILRAIEALSVIDIYSREICSSKEIFQLVCDLVKLQDKAEVSTSCVTAGILVANMLSEADNLVSEVSQDFSFLEGVFSILPFASDDIEVRRALWNVISRLLVRVNESEITISCLHRYAMVLVRTSDIIEDDLLDLQPDEPNEELESSVSPEKKPTARFIAIRKVVCVLDKWKVNKESIEEESLNGGCSVNEVDVERLLGFCRRYVG